MLFENWWGLLRVVTAAIMGYAALLVFLRISGKRTLSKLNAFDLVVTIALGSTLSTLILSRTTPIAEGVFALGMLILLQHVVAWTQIRFPRFQRLVKSGPRLLLYQGKFQHEAMRGERVTEDEVKAAIRDSGGTSVEGTFAVVLETDGTIVAVSAPDRFTTAMQSVRDFGDERLAS